MNRKILISTLMFLVLLFSLLNVAALGKEKVKITMWFHEPLYVKFFGMTSQEFAKLHPEYEFQFDIVQVPPNEIATKLLTALLTGKGAPDIVGNMIHDFPKILRAGMAEEGLLDLTPYIGERRKEFYETSWVPFTWKGKIYGVESALCPVVYYYQKPIFDEAGLSGSIELWDDFVKAGLKLKQLGKYMLALPLDDWTMLEMYLVQREGNFFDADGKAHFGDDKVRETLQFYSDLINKYKIAMLAENFYAPTVTAAYRDGKVAGAVMPDWYSIYVLKLTLPELKGKWRVTLLPRWEANGPRGTRMGGTGMGVTLQSEHKELAWKLIEYSYMTYRNQVRRYQEICYFPTMKAAAHDPAVIDAPDPYFGGQKVGAVFAKVADEIPLVYNHPMKVEAMTMFVKDAMVPVIRGSTTASKALSVLVNKIEKLLATQK